MKRKLIIKVGDKSLHAICMRSCFGKRAVENIQRVHYDDGIVSDGNILNPIALSGIIQEFMEGLRFKFLYEIVFLLNSSRVIIKDIHIPRVKHKNLRGVMINRIDELFPDIREFKYRYRVKEENESGFDMQVVFIPKDLYNGYNDVYKSLKLLKGTLDVGYNYLDSFIREGGSINGESLCDGEYILIKTHDFNGEIIHCSDGILMNHRSVYNTKGSGDLKKKIIEILYFDFDYVERDKTVILLGDGKEDFKKAILREFDMCPLFAKKICIHNREVGEEELNGFIDGFSRLYSNRSRRDHRINFLSKSRENGYSKIIYKAAVVGALISIFLIYRMNLDRALDCEMKKLGSLNEKGLTLVDMSIYEEKKEEEKVINTSMIGKREDLERVILLIQKYGVIREISFNGNKYDVKGMGRDSSSLGNLIRAFHKDEYKRSHLIGLSRNSGENWKFQIEVIR